MRSKVLILGGGLAGVACAHKLGDEGVPVTLVDRNDYHQFQPLLYQVASSQLPAEEDARPHRTISTITHGDHRHRACGGRQPGWNVPGVVRWATLTDPMW